MAAATTGAAAKTRARGNDTSAPVPSAPLLAWSRLPTEAVDTTTGFALRVPTDDDIVDWVEALVEGFTFINAAQSEQCIHNCDYVRAVIGEDGRAMGGFGFADQGMFLGGARVPCPGVVMVAIASHCRGKGAASAMLRQSLRDALRTGAPMLSLHPTAQHVYRKFGFERAASMFEYRVSALLCRPRDRRGEASPPEAPDTAGVPAGPTHRVRPVKLGAKEFAQLQGMYRRAACAVDGMVDRGQYLWDRLRYQSARAAPAERRSEFVYFIERVTSGPGAAKAAGAGTAGAGVGAGAGADSTGAAVAEDVAESSSCATSHASAHRAADVTVEGYIVAHMARHGKLRYPEVVLKDVQCTSAGGWMAVAQWLYSLRSTVEDVVWYGGTEHPLCALIGASAPDLKVSVLLTMLVRVVDFGAALQLRGYSKRVSAAIDFEVEDAHVPSNAGRLQLNVRDGNATVKKDAGKGTLVVAAAGLAPLITGFASARQLRAAGLLRAQHGTSEAEARDAMEAASDLFYRGSTPCYIDTF